MPRNKKKNKAPPKEQSQAELEHEPKFIEISDEDENEKIDIDAVEPEPTVKKETQKQEAQEDKTNGTPKSPNKKEAKPTGSGKSGDASKTSHKEAEKPSPKVKKEEPKPKAQEKKQEPKKETPKKENVKKTVEPAADKAEPTKPPPKKEEQNTNKKAGKKNKRPSESESQKTELPKTEKKFDNKSKAENKSQNKDEKKAEKKEDKKEESSKKVEKKDSDKDDDEHKPQGDCVMCGQLAKTFCSSCKHVFYCTREHQKSHWKSHKDLCKVLKALPYRVERNDQIGRHLVATLDIPAGQLIFEEAPMVLGPRQLTKPVCLGCHKELKDAKSARKCSRCAWPLCSAKCEDSKLHEPECRLIKYGGTQVKVDTFGQINMMYACITVLRALALQDSSQQLWKEYIRFDSHLEQRMKTEVYTKVNKEKVVFFIHHYLRLVSKFSDLEILETCGRLDTNCFEIKQNGLNLRAMYRTACIMSHDCRPNTKHTFSENNCIRIYSTMDIAKGSIISATYSQPLWNTPNRREHLYMSKCFWCACARCADPTEHGTFLSAVTCRSCGGRQLPVRPLDARADWACDRCGKTSPATTFSELHTKLTGEIKRLDRSDPGDLESWMKTCAPVLPDSHQLIKEVKYGLVCLFNIDQMELLTSNQLLRKSVLCKELLDLAAKIDPGLTKWRGELLYEMQKSAVILGKRALEEKKLNEQQAMDIFAENMGYLEEAETILSCEPDWPQKLQKEKKALKSLLLLE